MIFWKLLDNWSPAPPLHFIGITSMTSPTTLLENGLPTSTCWAATGRGGAARLDKMEGVSGGHFLGPPPQRTSVRSREILLMVQKSGEPVDMINIHKYPIIYRVLYIPGGAGFLPSTVWKHFSGWKKWSTGKGRWIPPHFPDFARDLV